MTSINENQTNRNSFIDMEEPTGFIMDDTTGEVKRNDSELTWSNVTRTLTIQPKAPATYFIIYIDGIKYEIDSPHNVIITDTNGYWHFYFNSSLTLIATQTFDQNFIYSQGYVAGGYWDSSSSRMLFDEVFDERHGCKMDGHTHAWLHQQFGTRYESGLALVNFDVDGSGNNNTNAQFGSDFGVIYDEDLKFNISSVASTVGLPILYHDAIGNWKQTTNSGFSVLTTGTGRLAYNPSGSGLVEVANNDFVNCHVFTTSGIDENGTIASIVGQQQYGNIIQAREGADSEINSLILTGLPVQEFKFIGTVIFQTSNTYSNSVKGRVRSTDTGDDYVDFRRTSITGVGAPSEDPNQNQIYYVGKHGNDSTGNGLKIETAFLTFQKAIDTAELQTPTSINRFVIKCNDAGIYTEDITISENYVSIDAKNSVLDGKITIASSADNLSVHFKEILNTDDDCIAITSTGSGYARIFIEEIVHSGTGYAINNTGGPGIYSEIIGNTIVGEIYINNGGSPCNIIMLRSITSSVTVKTGSVSFLESEFISGTINVESGAICTISCSDPVSITENFTSGSTVIYGKPSTRLTDSLGQWNYVSTMDQNVNTTADPTFNSLTLTNPLSESSGGTGESTYTDGQLLIGKTDTTLAKSTLTAGTGVSILNGDGTITISAAGGSTNPDQDNIYYVGKNGNDTTGTGLNIETAFLTQQKGIDTAFLQSPSFTNKYVVKTNDAGTYDVFNLTSKPYILVEMTGAQVRGTGGTLIIGEENIVKIDRISTSATVGTLVRKVDSGVSSLEVNTLDGNGVTNYAIDVDEGFLSVTATASMYTISTVYFARIQNGCTMHALSKFISGKLLVEGTGLVYIIANNYNGNIEVTGTGSVYIVLSGIYSGTVTAAAGSTVSIICSRRSILFGSDSVAAGATVRILETQNEVKPEDNIYYVGSFGDDNRDGKRIEESFETFSKAITDAQAFSPTDVNQVVICSPTASTFEEQNTITSSYVNIDAPTSTLRYIPALQTTGNTLLVNGGQCTIKLKRISAFSSDAALCIDSTASSASTQIDVDEISNVGIGRGLDIQDGYVYGHVGNLNGLTVGSSGKINLIIDRSIGNITFDNGSDGVVLILKRTAGTISKGATSTVSVIDLTDGLGIPFMTQSQRLALSPTTLSFAVYDTTEGKIYFYQNGSWVPLSPDDEHTPNILVGGDYSVNPRQSLPNGSTSTTDDMYVADNTILLSDGNNIVNVSEAEYKCLSMRTATINKQFGVLIPVEKLDSAAVLQTEIASLSIRARWSGLIGTRNIRMALLSWVGTDDNITSDVVATWQGAGSNPILATNWSYVNTPSNLPLVSAPPSSWHTFKIEGFSVGTTGVRNLAVFVWVDDVVIGTLEQLDISNIKLTNSSFAGGFHPREAAEELLLCQRYYAKSVSTHVDPFTATGSGSSTVFKSSSTASPTLIGMNVDFPATMLSSSVITPTLTPFSPANGASGNVRNDTTSSNIAATGVSVSSKGGKIQLSAGISAEAQISYQWVADSRL